MAAISSMAPRFMTSGYGSAPGSVRKIGPTSRPSMTPHSSSPKCTSLTVAIVGQPLAEVGQRAEREAVELVVGARARGR